MATCYKCGKIEVAEEFDRCLPCEDEHKKLCARLDAQPKHHEVKVREKLHSWKEMKRGIEVTNYISYEDARIMGIKLPESKEQ